ncbi:hypothetical protein A3B18_02960 [Candidatus Giovannonibacteria bacterium RIFCSPLOWO2_01_FULL_46_13]|uniref:Uncharacterized protein n=1 Tax=Candidatus Giovannonibacteria bacterium RIFCSPLOWO2_01_FULL_46_13 TaxID=1798352 RepID=A0A1F5X316_9BACT|nr:MAG: hypothetical protein A3B18_02960 [Candidatus Giovannonibacteria bacterium RIFCSPLOWO2_01_FULL_46_13]
MAADPGFYDLKSEGDVLAFSCFCESFARDIKSKNELDDEDREELVRLLDAGDKLSWEIRGNIDLYETYAYISGTMSELRKYVLQ